jgi:hypothetical protein
MRPAAALLAISLPAILLQGACTSGAGGTVEAVGSGDAAVRLASEFTSGTYAVEPAATTVVFSDVPYEQLAAGTARNGRFLHIEVLWRPRAGKTPIETSSTNLTIRFVVISDGEVGVYVGGGFAWVEGGREKDDELSLEITGSSISLIDKTPGFVDLLSPASLVGELGALRNADNARATRRAASQFVTNRLGRVRWVQSMPEGGWRTDAAD